LLCLCMIRPLWVGSHPQAPRPILAYSSYFLSSKSSYFLCRQTLAYTYITYVFSHPPNSKHSSCIQSLCLRLTLRRILQNIIFLQGCLVPTFTKYHSMFAWQSSLGWNVCVESLECHSHKNHVLSLNNICIFIIFVNPPWKTWARSALSNHVRL
jgi:hypothetical protein